MRAWQAQLHGSHAIRVVKLTEVLLLLLKSSPGVATVMQQLTLVCHPAAFQRVYVSSHKG